MVAAPRRLSAAQRSWAALAVTGAVVAAAAVGGAAQGAPAGYTATPPATTTAPPPPGGAPVPPATLAGTPCATDDDCGGYATFPPLWCGTGWGSPTPTCRSSVPRGAPCNSSGVACWPGQTCRPSDGVCGTRDGGGVAGDKCLPAAADTGRLCAAGLTCLLTPKDGWSCYALSGVGEPCGVGATACGEDLLCVDGAGGRCAEVACPGGAGVCAPVVAGDPCRERVTCPASGFACHWARLGGPATPVRRQCVATIPPGGACETLGARRCAAAAGEADADACVGGVCVPLSRSAVSPVLSAQGDECALIKGCTGGAVCVSGERRLELGFGGAACFALRAEGESCGEATFELCDVDAQLVCGDGGRCVASSAAVTGAALGAFCSTRLDEPCAPAADGGEVLCRTVTVEGADFRNSEESAARCVRQVPDGGACTDPSECRDTCTDAGLCGRPAGIRCAGECRGDLQCRRLGSDLPNLGSFSFRSSTPGWCVTVRPVGSPCDGELEQCVVGARCAAGVCTAGTPLGSPCADAATCNGSVGNFAGCYRGPGAAWGVRTCRSWAWWGAPCAGNAGAKCWTTLRCDDGAGGTGRCENINGNGVAGAFCNDAPANRCTGGRTCTDWDAWGRGRCVAYGAAGALCDDRYERCQPRYRCTPGPGRGPRTCTAATDPPPTGAGA